jgi:hypothetical protein
MKSEMNRISSPRVLAAALAFLLSITALSAKQVQFRVDLGSLTANATKVHVAGDFQVIAGYSEDWNPELTEMTNIEGTTIYAVTVNIPAFHKYEYRFYNGNQGYDSEFIPDESRVGYDYDDNRWVYIDSSDNEVLALPAIVFAGNAPKDKYLIRFKVDLEKENIASGAKISVYSPTDGWNQLTSRLYCFTGKYYEGIQYFSSGELLYKYKIDDNFETLPSSCSTDEFRLFSVGKDSAFPEICYANCTICSLVSVEEISSADDVTISPIPSYGRDIVLQAIGGQSFLGIEVINSAGDIVYKQNLSSEQTITLNKSNFLNGAYLVVMQMQNGKSVTAKLIFN